MEYRKSIYIFIFVTSSFSLGIRKSIKSFKSLKTSLAKNIIQKQAHKLVPDFEQAMQCYTFRTGMPRYIDNNWFLAKKVYYVNHWLRKYGHQDASRDSSYKIPKIIHHIWLGSPLPERFKPLIASWKKHHPSWKHVLWTDKEVEQLNLVNKKLFTRCKNYGLKSDIARYEILTRYGGFYADIDLECLQPLDILHKKYDFYACLFPNQSIIANGVIGSAPGHPILKTCVAALKRVKKINEELPGEIQQQTGPGFFTRVVFNHLKKTIRGSIILPASYFFAYPVNLRFAMWSDHEKFKKRLSYAVPEAFGIHYWANTWLKKSALPELNMGI